MNVQAQHGFRISTEQFVHVSKPVRHPLEWDERSFEEGARKGRSPRSKLAGERVRKRFQLGCNPTV